MGKYIQSEDLSDVILNHTPNGIIVIDNKGNVKFANSVVKRMFENRKLAGINVLSLDNVKNTKFYGAIIKAINGSSINVMGESYILCSKGNKKILNVYMSPVLSHDGGRVSKVILVLHDVTREFNLGDEIESTYLSTIEALAETIDARDGYTGEHSKNVLKYTSLICEGLQLDDEVKRRVKLAASIHDIGKIGIKDNILNKPGKLTIEEYEQMKEHSVIGANIIKKINGFEDISNIIKHHHERWDGKGYPNGLKNREIPLGSQIIAIADTYDAIISDRVYRKGLGQERAIEILLEEKDKQFNSTLVDTFIEMITKD